MRQWAVSCKNKKLFVAPPILTCRRVGPTRGAISIELAIACAYGALGARPWVIWVMPHEVGAQVCGTAGGLMGHMGHAAQSAAVKQAGEGCAPIGASRWVIGVIWAVGIKSLAA